jgi:hypothetical protein
MLIQVIAAVFLALPTQGTDQAGDVGFNPEDAPVWRMTLDTGVTVNGQQSFLQDVFLSAGDIDRDGRDDVLIGSQSEGTITVRSGRNGKPILELTGDPALGFGQSVGPAGDINGDGFDDIIWGESFYLSVEGQLGRAVVSSGKTGKTLLEIPGRLAGDRTGFAVSGVGDIDGDGRSDIGVGSPGVSRVSVYSGANGALLMDIEESSPPYAIGQLVRGAGDVDGDGTPDVLVGILDISFADFGRSARVYSGADGSILFTIDAGPAINQIDLSMDAAGDVDGDGLDDIVVLLRNGFDTSAGVFGGPDGFLIAEYDLGPPIFAAPPRIVDVAGAGDVDGDGHADILVGTLDLVTGGYVVISGATGFVRRLREFPSDPNIAVEVSVNQGGDVNGDGFADVLLALHQIEGAVVVTPSRGRVIFGGDPWFIRLGDRLRDHLSPGLADLIQFDAVAGTRLDVIMKSVSKNGFVPGLSLDGPGRFVALPAEASGAGARASIRKLALPDTGTYTMRLGYGIPELKDGTYSLRTRARPPRGKGLVQAGAPGDAGAPFTPGNRVRGTVAGAAPTRVTVDLVAGSLLSLRVRASGGSDLDPVLRVLDPEAAVLDLEGVTGQTHRVIRLPVPSTGTYVIEVRGDRGTQGEFLMRTKARTPRGKARIDAPDSLDLP